MNKGELAAWILDDTHRVDLASKTNDFIRQAEAMISRYVRANEMILLGTITDADRVTPGGGLFNMPTNSLAIRAMWAPTADGGMRELEAQGLSYLRRMPASAAVHWYAVRGNVVEFRGTPSDTDVIEIDHYAKVAALVDDTDETDLLNAHEELYIAAATFFLYRYTQDIDAAQAYLDSFKDASSKVNELTAHKIGGGGTPPAYNFNNQSSY